MDFSVLTPVDENVSFGVDPVVKATCTVSASYARNHNVTPTDIGFMVKDRIRDICHEIDRDQNQVPKLL